MDYVRVLTVLHRYPFVIRILLYQVLETTYAKLLASNLRVLRFDDSFTLLSTAVAIPLSSFVLEDGGMLVELGTKTRGPHKLL